MPKNINPIRKQILKANLIQGKSIRQSLKNAGYTERTAHGHCDKDFPVVSRCIKEILSEADKRGIIDKAWKVCEEGLDKSKTKYTLAQALATKSMTEKQEVNNKHPDKVIISYTKDTQPIKDKEVTKVEDAQSKS